MDDFTQELTQTLARRDGPLHRMLENVDFSDAQATGATFGNIVTSLLAAVQTPSDVPPMERMLQTVFGQDEARRLLREQEIKHFFKVQLFLYGMREAVRVTKAHFQLPDDYKLKISIDVTFESVTKSEVPDVD